MSQVVFSNSLKRADANVIGNLRKMQDHYNNLILEVNSKQRDLEERMLNIFHQKQRILTNLNYEVQNHSVAIRAIDDWIALQQTKTQGLHLLEENLQLKMNNLAEAQRLKGDNIEEKIKAIDTQQQMLAGRQKSHQEMLRQVKQEVAQLGDTIETMRVQLRDGKSDHVGALAVKVEAMERQIEQTKREAKLGSQSVEEFTRKERGDREIEAIRKDSFQLDRKQKVLLSKEKFIENNYLSVERYSLDKQSLPRKPQLLVDVQESSKDDARRGVRGLLQRSHQKAKTPSKFESLLPLSPLSRKKKSLPPVREDPLARKKKQLTRQSEEEQTYQVDEEGYLMDEQGNYLQDQYGQMVRMTEEQMDALREEEGYA